MRMVWKHCWWPTPQPFPPSPHFPSCQKNTIFVQVSGGHMESGPLPKSREKMWALRAQWPLCQQQAWCQLCPRSAGQKDTDWSIPRKVVLPACLRLCVDVIFTTRALLWDRKRQNQKTKIAQWRGKTERHLSLRNLWNQSCNHPTLHFFLYKIIFPLCLCVCLCVYAKLLQSCPTLCYSKDLFKSI